MNQLSRMVMVLALAACKPAGPEGSARLPDCTEAAQFDLDGTTWFDEGTVTLTSRGCDAAPGSVFGGCGRAWAFKQQGSELEILVDQDLIHGRMCLDELHLEGGFWFTVHDEARSCDYEREVEVGIEAGSATLEVSDDQLVGTIALRGPCTADYAVRFHR